MERALLPPFSYDVHLFVQLYLGGAAAAAAALTLPGSHWTIMLQQPSTLSVITVRPPSPQPSPQPFPISTAA